MQNALEPALEPALKLGVCFAHGRWARILPVLLLVCVWQELAVILGSKTLPPPSAVLSTLWQELHAGDLLFHLGMTLRRVALSFFAAKLIGVALGILMGQSKNWDRLLDTFLILALNIPALVIIILCYIWFGLSETAAVLAVTVNKIPMVAISLREALSLADRVLFLSAPPSHLILDLPVELPHPRTVEDVSVQQLHASLLKQYPQLLCGLIAPSQENAASGASLHLVNGMGWE